MRRYVAIAFGLSACIALASAGVFWAFGGRKSLLDVWLDTGRAEGPEEAERYLGTLGPEDLMAFASQACASAQESGSRDTQQRIGIWLVGVFWLYAEKTSKSALGEKMESVALDRAQNALFRVEALIKLEDFNPERLPPERLNKLLEASYYILANESVAIAPKASSFIGHVMLERTRSAVVASGLLTPEDMVRPEWPSMAKERGFVNPYQADLDRAVQPIFAAVVRCRDWYAFGCGLVQGFSWCFLCEPSVSVKEGIKRELVRLISDPSTPNDLYFAAMSIFVNHYDVKDIASPQVTSEIAKRTPAFVAAADEWGHLDRQYRSDDILQKLRKAMRESGKK